MKATRLLRFFLLFFISILIVTCGNDDPISNNDGTSAVKIVSAVGDYYTSYSNKIDTIPVGGKIRFKIEESLLEGIKSFTWSFPAGTPSTSTNYNPVITYNINGKYPVTVTITTNSGKVITKTEDNKVVIGSGYKGTWTKVFEIQDNINMEGWSRVNAGFTKFQFLNNKIYAISHASGIFCSSDGGINWTSIVGNLPKESDDTFAPIYGIKEIFFDSNILYLCCKSGIYKSANNGSNWIKIYDCYLFGWMVGLYPLSIVKSGNNLIAFIQNQEGRLIISKDNGLTWSIVLNTDNEQGWSHLDFLGLINPSTVVAIDGSNKKRFVSTDNGLSWSSSNVNFELEQITILGNKLYAIDGESNWGSGKLLCSSDYGETWSPTEGILHSFGTYDPEFFNFENFLLYRCELSLNNGKSFIDISDNLSNEYSDSSQKYYTFPCSAIINNNIFSSTGLTIFKRPLSDFKF